MQEGWGTDWNSSKSLKAFEYFAAQIRKDNPSLGKSGKIFVILDGDSAFVKAASVKAAMIKAGFDPHTLPPRSPDAQPLDFACFVHLESKFLEKALASKSRATSSGGEDSDDEYMPGDENSATTKNSIVPKEQVASWLATVPLSSDFLKTACRSMKKRIQYWADNNGDRYMKKDLKKQRGIWK